MSPDPSYASKGATNARLMLVPSLQRLYFRDSTRYDANNCELFIVLTTYWVG